MKNYMDIKRAGEEIKNAVKAYLAVDEEGNKLIPEIRQRPILLIGPPGIGKTAIMEQVARECGIPLAAYTMTHHTRQSAMGLPFIQEKEFDGVTHSVTSYTMSEIIASVYEKMEKTGLKQGILFIDEINCVSETLSPVMLQFLQGKIFGNTKVPKDWIIVAAGNPPEYNRMVHEFDVVTLDRVKIINVEPDYNIWKEYAKKNMVHQSIISYLDAKQENFYKIETTVDGKRFVTARGWEDLSSMIKACEKLNINVDEEVISQYIAQPDISMDFANYLSLYYKYERAYSVSSILEGNADKNVKDRLLSASFDEKISVVGLILGALNAEFTEYYKSDMIVTKVYDILKYFQKNTDMTFDELYEYQASEFNRKLQSGLFDEENKKITKKVIKVINAFNLLIKERGLTGHDEEFDCLTGEFAKLTDEREAIVEKTALSLDNSFSFVEEIFGQGAELVLFVTELAAGFYSIKFIQENGCSKFYEYNKTMLRENVRDELVRQIEAL